MPLAKKFTKSLFSGGYAALTYLALTYTLTEFLRIHYLTSVIFAFLASFFLNFSLQKFWTFGEKNTRRIPRQLFFFTLLVVCNVMVSTSAIYFLVEIQGMWYIHAQIIMLGALAVINFIIYNFIFRKEEDRQLKMHNGE